MAPAERTAAERAASAIDADRKPKALSIQLLLETGRRKRDAGSVTAGVDVTRTCLDGAR
jgi:hypothetical protein